MTSLLPFGSSVELGSDVALGGFFTVLVSVCSKNKPSLLEKAVALFFLNTRLPEMGWAIVDDPFADVLKWILERLALTYGGILELLRLRVNRGVPSALNVGLQMILHPWIDRADSDDDNPSYSFATFERKLQEQPLLDLRLNVSIAAPHESYSCPLIEGTGSYMLKAS